MRKGDTANSSEGNDKFKYIYENYADKMSIAPASKVDLFVTYTTAGPMLQWAISSGYQATHLPIESRMIRQRKTVNSFAPSRPLEALRPDAWREIDLDDYDRVSTITVIPNMKKTRKNVD